MSSTRRQGKMAGSTNAVGTCEAGSDRPWASTKACGRRENTRPSEPGRRPTGGPTTGHTAIQTSDGRSFATRPSGRRRRNPPPGPEQPRVTSGEQAASWKRADQASERRTRVCLHLLKKQCHNHPKIRGNPGLSQRRGMLKLEKEPGGLQSGRTQKTP